MISICTLTSACALLGLTEPGVALRAADTIVVPQVIDTRPQDEWTFDAFIYYWSASVAGELAIEGNDVDLEDGGDGVFDISALTGFLGDFEAHHGPWSYVFAPIFVSVDMDGEPNGVATDANVEIDAQIHEGFVAHDTGYSWQWFVGARYYELETELGFSTGGVPSGSADSINSWIDPIVGARYRGALGEDWSMAARADIGGFGVGSDFAWNTSLLFGYHFSKTIGAHVGYRALSVNFDDHTGDDHTEVDLSMYGPVIGVSFSF